MAYHYSQEYRCRRVRFSPAPIKELKLNKRETPLIYKPNPAIWYSCEGVKDDMSWYHWCRSEDFGIEGLKYAYLVDVDSSKICVIRTTDELDAFHEEYSYMPEFMRMPGMSEAVLEKYQSRLLHGWIHWDVVAEKYAGVEIAPYNWKRRHDYMWYYSVDCASGCIWDLDAIRIVKEIPVKSAVVRNWALQPCEEEKA